MKNRNNKIERNEGSFISSYKQIVKLFTEQFEVCIISRKEIDASLRFASRPTDSCVATSRVLRHSRGGEMMLARWLPLVNTSEENNGDDKLTLNYTYFRWRDISTRAFIGNNV